MIVAYRNGAAIRVGDIGVAVDGAENNQVRGFQNGKLGMLLLIYKQPGTNVIDAVRASRRRCRTSLTPCRRRSRSPGDRPHHDHQGLGEGRGGVAAARDHPGGDGDLRVPAQLLGHRIPGVTVPLALFGTAALMLLWATASTTCR